MASTATMIWTSTAAALLALCAGFALQRGGICAVLAMREVVEQRRWARFLSFLECAAWALGGLLVANAFGLMSIGAWPTPVSIIAAAAGGAIFGLGATVNGACAFGSLGRLARGEASFLVLPPAFVVGAVIAHRVGLAWRSAPMAFGITGAAFAALIAALAVFALWRICTALRSCGGAASGAVAKLKAPNWPPALAMAVTALANVGLLLLVANWPYTTLLVDIALGRRVATILRVLLVLVFLTGAVIGAGRNFSFKSASTRDLALRATGGVVMGLGAAMIPGGNDALVLVGLPLLQPAAFAAYGAMVCAIGLSCLMRPRSGAAVSNSA